MKSSNLFFSFLALMLLFFGGCDSKAPSIKSDDARCPKCNMSIPDSKIHTAKLYKNAKTYFFDDIGCLIIWAKENGIDLNHARVEVFSNDTHKYIQARKAYFSINEKTPMNYGFSAYENKKTDKITIDKVVLKMLRGEHMANPKIRKQILGN